MCTDCHPSQPREEECYLPAPLLKTWGVGQSVFIFLPSNWGGTRGTASMVSMCLVLGPLLPTFGPRWNPFGPLAGGCNLQTPHHPTLSPPPCILCNHFLGLPKTYT